MLIRLTHNNKFEANKWLVTARWFYAPAIFFIGLVLKLDPLGNNFFPVPLMMFLFFSFVLVNLWFWVMVRRIELKNDDRLINKIAIGQVFSELLFFLIILHFSGGDQSVSPVFFFIPIVTSIVLFDVLGSLSVALVSAVFVNGILLLDYAGYLKHVFGYTGNGFVSYDEFILRLMSTVTYTSVYFIVGSLAGYLTSVIKRREGQLVEGKHRAQFQAERLRLLNNEYSGYARMLVRRDLELRKENQKITALDKEKSEFVSTVAHQLRTPLSAIKWTLDILLKEDAGSLNSEQKALVMKAYESNERIINLIRDMLGVDRLESGTGLSFFEISISDLVNNIVAEFQSQIERRHIRIDLNVEPDIPKVSVDPQKMRAVFQNLIENAVKYTTDEINISLKKEGENIKVVISDNGIGIPDAQHQDIFKRFFRAENAMKRDPDGSGLGLFIVRSIIQRHGGEIEFKSGDNKGATFTFTVPLHH